MIDKFKNHYFKNYSKKYSYPKIVNSYLDNYLKDVNADYLELAMKHFEAKNGTYYRSTGSSGKFVLTFTNCFISAPINDKISPKYLFHELGHAVDYVPSLDGKSLGKYNSSTMILSCGKSLNSCLIEELGQVKDILCAFIEERFNSEFITQVQEDKFNKLINNIKLKKQLMELNRKISKYCTTSGNYFQRYALAPAEIKTLIKERNRIKSKILSIEDENNLRRCIYDNQAYMTFACKYNLLIDMLSVYYPLNKIFPVHSKSYQKMHLGIEFFAETFASHILNKYDEIELTKRFFPKTHQCFIQLIEYSKTLY